MPIYTYQCEECKLIDDKLVSLSDSDKDSICGKCNGTMKRIFDSSGTSLFFKGKWFKTEGKY